MRKNHKASYRRTAERCARLHYVMKIIINYFTKHRTLWRRRRDRTRLGLLNTGSPRTVVCDPKQSQQIIGAPFFYRHCARE